MSCADSDPTLSARHRAALRFDLEDRQIDLIDELHGLADTLFGPLRKASEPPDGWYQVAARLDAPDPLAALRQLDRTLSALYSVNRALARIDGPGFGHCSVCREPLAFDALAEDPTRAHCPTCGPGRGAA